ncbi:WecB/TagA/CpsF family glycosyltransferase [Candidatus Saccharibacteria bacterium]|nr:WecB/TagA/CpsF family glycosyltransferase [Candidatus Saccharibacteria bacterium]
MNRVQVDILGVLIDPVTKSEVLKIVEDRLESSSPPTYITKPYVEFLSLAKDDAALQKILNQSMLCLADGVSLQWAASYLYGKPRSRPNLFRLAWSGLVNMQKMTWRNQIIPEKMAGINLTVPILKLAEKKHYKIGVLGGPINHEMTAQSLIKRFPGLSRVESWSGYYDLSNERKLVADIASSKLDILFVAMGFPKQELFMAKYREYVGVKLMIGEGGSFDYDELGGQIRRAPAWIQKSGLEWLWRLFRQPSRIGRQLAIPKFVWAVHRQARSNWRKNT